MLRSFDLEKETLEEDNPFDYFLQSTACAIRSTYHTTLQATPLQLVYSRDMIHNIEFKANWNRIQKENKTQFTSLIKKKIRVRYLTSIRLETKYY